MSDPGDGSGLDADLHESFAALRRQEEAAAPSFEAALADGAARRRRRPRGHDRRFRPLTVATATAAVALAVVVFTTFPGLKNGAWPPASSVRPAPSITSWRPATDFLLRTPGQEVLTTPPTFGSDPSLGMGSPLSNRRETERKP